MFSKLSRTALPAARLVLRPRVASVRPASAGIHTAVPTFADAAASSDDAGALDIDKSNPLYAPDAWNEWMNAGYTNLGPKDSRGWKDLPFPYKYYDVKVDPADVESKGLLWTIFTDWRTALPATGLLALPMYLYDVFVLDERVMLALITWFTFGILRTQVGPALGESFKQQAEAEAQELYDVEAAYRKALGSAKKAHLDVLGLVDDLKAKHTAERGLKDLEAKAAYRELKVEQTIKMRSMLDYLILSKAETVAEAQRSVVDSSFKHVADLLKSDDKFQQQSINDSLEALAGNKAFGDMAVVTSFLTQMNTTVDAMTKAGVPADVRERQRELFAKKFGFGDSVTEAMLEAAQGNPKEWAALVAKCGGTEPTVGTPLQYKMPIDC